MEQQENLIKRLHILPNNLLLVGPKYSGKKTLVSEIAPDFIYVSSNVDAIRNIGNGNLVFADVDNWSPACFSAMLKLLEENESNHYIITCTNIMNLPRSIISRCIVEKMEPYLHIKNYCDNIGQLQFYSDDMLKDIDKFKYNDNYDIDVYFTVLCNRLLDRIKNGENLETEYLISSKFNAAKNLKSLNKKQFIVNWQLCIKGLSEVWKKL